MDRYTTAIIGGGASGLVLASALSSDTGNTILFERGDRLGKKLSATGNGQGNITNLGVLDAEYFSSKKTGTARVQNLIRAYDHNSLMDFLRELGVLLIADDRGRVYPAGRQASSLTDALRYKVAQKGVDVRLQSKVLSIKRKGTGEGSGFLLTVQTANGEERVCADNVVLCAGGKAAKNFGTDGTAYALAEEFGHTVTPLYPSLVQLKTDTAHTKMLKGIRVNDALLTATFKDGSVQEKGDVIFTDYGVSGDAVFRISAFIADKIAKDEVTLTIDFLPDFSQTELLDALQNKRKNFSELPVNELLGGMVNNQVGRMVFKRAQNDVVRAAALVKNFTLTVTGSLGFDYAQVTKGGVRLDETDEALQSVFVNGLYFAGEILDVDGQCGGFNLQWAYSSARCVAAAIEAKISKGRGQV